MPEKIAILTINNPSYESAEKLEKYLKNFSVEIFKKDRDFKKLDDILPHLWSKFDAIVCILAIGAVVRKIAPYLKDKSSDPAILVINLDLTRIIPLLSGHLGGANELASFLEKNIPNCINFITTATDQKNVLAFEILAKKRGWRIENLKALANISNRLLNNQKVGVFTCKAIFKSIEKQKNLYLINDPKELDKNCVIIYPGIKSKNLTMIPKVSLGIGCNKNTTKDEIQKAFFSFLDKFNLKIEDIKTLSSFEAKSEEIGLLEFAKEYNFDIIFYKKDEINSVETILSKSKATEFFEIKGVAEPSAILSSHYKELVFKKEIYNKKITIAGAI